MVSSFKVSCKEIRKNLADKHIQIAEDEIELIAKQAKLKANELLDIFEKMDMKILTSPKDIEELTSIKDYMATVPNEIEKLSVEIKACMNIYETLNFFSYKFSDDEEFDRKWNVFKVPKETLDKIDK